MSITPLSYVDIEVTNSCNFRCSYCYEKDHYHSDMLSIESFENILKRLSSYTDIGSLHLVLWGGEPLLNYSLVEYIFKSGWITKFRKLLILTNGSLLNHYIDLFKQYKSKVWIQISYDGEPIHSKNRFDINGKSTTSKVLESLDLLYQNNIEFSLKPTLPLNDLHHMFEAYKDYVQLSETFKNMNLMYNPTLDHYLKDISDEALDVLYQQLVKIVRFSVKKGYTILSWLLEDKKPLCSAGVNMFSIRMNGDVYPCHGCFYHNSNMHKWGNIFSLTNEELDRFRYNYHQALNKAKSKDRQCDYSFCRRCNVTAFKFSEKQTYFDKWIDFKSQPLICKTSKIIHIAKQAYKALVRG